ncbi:MAG TPA: iron ABC transporter substrate-binding protein [Candidatus Binatia bacterium]|nr:iron ABC transporter substrate-binding protein [Candidatus Binatia bacterium]
MRRLLASLLVLGISAAACGSSGSSPGASPSGGAPSSPPPATGAEASPTPTPGGRLVVYSGRSEELVGPLIEQFEKETGIEVEVRYAGTSELAATLLEEGANSPADVFFAQDAGALGAVAKAGLSATLPAEILDRVDPRFRSPQGTWVGVSGRVRVAVYDSRELGPEDLPSSVLGFTDPAWKGRIGWAPTNASFHSFVTALRVLRGEEAARSWLEGMLANEPRAYEGNSQALQAVAAGEIDVALVNHYYLMRQLAEAGSDYPVRNHFFGAGDPGSLVNVAGAALLTTSKNRPAAEAFVAFLVGAEAQRYFAEKTFEYPLVPDVPAPAGLPALADLEAPAIDLSDLADLEGTLELLREVGVL